MANIENEQQNVDADARHSDAGKRLAKLFGLLAWLAVIALIFCNREHLTVENIIDFTPKNPVLAALLILALFALKSLSIVMYSGILYAADGILFPLPVAIVLNLLGSAIMVTIPYWIGRRAGRFEMTVKNAKVIRFIDQLRLGNDLLLSFLTRSMNVLPLDVVSLYLGSIKLDYVKYLLGSVIGMLPNAILFPVMGMSLTDPDSPQFLMALLCEILFSAVGVIAFLSWKRKQTDKKVS